MANYERVTASGVRDVLRLAEEILKERIPIEKTDSDSHSITLSGRDGTVRIEAQRSAFDTIVRAETDQLRTSRLDLETQYFLSKLPYQPSDQPRG